MTLPNDDVSRHDPNDPNPIHALCLERTLDLAPEATAAVLANTGSRSRRFLFPVVNLVSRLFIRMLCVVRAIAPNAATSSKWLHRGIYWGLKTFVRPEANLLILRHFHIGSQVLGFIADNAGVTIPRRPLRPVRLADLKDNLFVEHDINLFNFIIEINQALAAQGRSFADRVGTGVNFGSVSEEIEVDALPDKWHNVIDLETAIAAYTPVYQLLLPDADFRRAVLSLQFDETIATYVAVLLDDASQLHLVSNRHPLLADSRVDAARHLALHGLGTERFDCEKRFLWPGNGVLRLVCCSDCQGCRG